MANLTVRILPNRNYPKDSDIGNLLKYIKGQGVQKYQLITYQNTNGLAHGYRKAARQIIRTQQIYNKHEDKRRMYHMVVSFPVGFSCPDLFIAEVADSIGQDYLQDYQTYYAVHDSTDNLHIHFAINAVSYKTGKKWHKSKRELLQLRHDILNIVNTLQKKYHLHERYKLCI